MAKSNLLKTQDVTFLDLIGNGKKYRVPSFQRDYAWEEEQWEDLWNDIIELRDVPGSFHYMGALVVEASSDREFQIIDGQQRVATLSVLALAVIHRLKAMPGDEATMAANADRAAQLRSRFIGEKDPASLLESSKLFLNDTDDGFYQDYLVQLRQPLNPRGLPKSNRLLWQCFGWFDKRLTDLGAQGEALARLLSDTVARQLLFILITVEDDISAYTVFETLNARGLELSSTDLLKNYLFSRVAAKSDLTALQRRWRQMIGTVKHERFPEFLRYHLLCRFPQVRKQRLFKTVRDEVRSSADVFALMDALEQRADLFAAMDDTAHEFWQERPAARPYIRDLQLFGVRQHTPLVFAAWTCLSPDDFVRVLKLLCVVSFRYTAVGGLNTNELEPVYHRAAKGLLDGELATPAAVFNALRSIYVDDDKFVRDFSNKEMDTSGRRKKLVKYVLCHLETDAFGVAREWETDPGTIEHVLPENPSSGWDEAFSPERQKDFVYRLGNFLLLESSINRSCQNAEFAQKLTLYASSAYGLTKGLAESGVVEWNPATLGERQSRMATRAAHVWRADFA
ncbi:DUF262 domain-containing HNH endonuclease family protein [Aquabacterium sp.]|uniref:DUF262 domain-containing protein n=1 Tax=Aquabacterium sp. TaxID=1872578 RepID=UPI0024872B58|nr:DUF262 domain-containing HNH endonuclease family protein [Aquabacterium sp.]MDI1260505.1 DUF262 domain-containing HNH endonuclease family protein [Aquabacterium sp.]